MSHCPYVTSLDRECGRPATGGLYCDFHAVLAQLDAFDPCNPVWPLVDRILGG